MALDFGIRPSGLRVPARFEMKGVSRDPEKPHVISVHHLGVSNPAVMNALLKGQKPADGDVIAQLVERGGLSWENIAADPTAENLADYFAQLIDNGYGELVLELWAFANDAKNFGAPVGDPTKLGEALPPG